MMNERMGEYGGRYEDNEIDDTPDLETAGQFDEMEENLEGKMESLYGSDRKMVEDILRMAKTGFEKRPAKWQPLLESLIDLLDEEHEDDDVLSGRIQDKLAEANDLVEN